MSEKLSCDEVPHKFSEWLLGMGCPAEKVPSIEKISQMCRGQYYMVWRSLMEHVEAKDLIRQKRLQVFCNDIKLCQERNVFNEHSSSIVVPEELKLWKQKKELREKVAEAESRVESTLKTQKEIRDKIICKVSQRNHKRHQIKDMQRRSWLLQQVSNDLAAKKDNLEETKSISNSLCKYDNDMDVQVVVCKLNKCLSPTRTNQQFPMPKPVASSSVVSHETETDRDEIMMSLAKCRADILWPRLYERRVALVEKLSVENTKQDKGVLAKRCSPQTVLAHTSALQASLGLQAMKFQLQMRHTMHRIAANVNRINKLLTSQSCELLVLRCEKARSEARVKTIKTLLTELSENSGVFGVVGAGDSSETTPREIASIDKCIVESRDELKRLLLSLAATEHKMNNTRNCLVDVFKSFQNNTVIDEDGYRGIHVDFPVETMSVLKQFYTDTCEKTRNCNLSMEFEMSDCSYNEAVATNPRFTDELRFYLKNFNLENNRKLVLDNGDKMWIFETLKSLSSKLSIQLGTKDVALLSPCLGLWHVFRQLADDVQEIETLEGTVKDINVKDVTGFSIDIKSHILKDESIMDKVKKCISDNSNMLSKINKTLDISMEDLQFWYEGNLKKFISSKRTVDGKTYRDYETLYCPENITIKRLNKFF